MICVSFSPPSGATRARGAIGNTLMGMGCTNRPRALKGREGCAPQVAHA
jgi:hypothetical protein